ncbi:pituitary tumor-transforming gene 1 protein-interacting protein isoform X2 [Alosa pseudoharengus]|uniref:pituitary tumor-transforming gene 1 protein-interacting protein isoform X2 n=1 Tax=Alosa sapidissima TaxID=34773 RepID=UPI001C096D32|nr:pituitary tumor-transforming gene 1 protein-interacting protein isoform X2 [Alosa sapidissima]
MPTQGACSSTFVVFIVVICAVVQQGTCVTPSPTSPTPVQKPCNVRTSCEDCLANVTCLWCMTNNTCSHYPVSSIIPPSSVCSLSQARWGVCWVNFEALIITMAVVVGTILLSVMVCCCCCYCCRKSSSGPDRDEERLARRREEARQRSDDRRVDRKARHDEIRKKYGLVPDADHPYSKFENE